MICFYETQNNRIMINSITDKKAPIFGLQWHPEKTLFVFNPVLTIDHTIFAIVVSQYIANVFVGLARQNSNHFKSIEEERFSLVYKYKTLYVGNMTGSSYEQMYLIPPFEKKKIQ